MRAARPNIASCLILTAMTSTIASPASSAPNRAGVAEVFREAKIVCERDAGQLWGKTLCGPIIIVDPEDQGAIANQKDASGVLRPNGGLYEGRLPDTVTISNTPIEWSGTRWTELLWPLRPKGIEAKGAGAWWLPVELAHEMFHRIQPGLGLSRPEGGNEHLDTLNGRYLLQLEWRALSAALTAKGDANRKTAIEDAILFRRERYREFPNASVEEYNLEIGEGIPEYTGVRIGLADPKQRVEYAVYDLSAFADAPSFVRGFAYATGPSYGLLLDRADPKWRTKLAGGRRLDEMLTDAAGLKEPNFGTLQAREQIYDDGTLRTREEARNRERTAYLADLKARLVDGPTLELPLSKASFVFNPQTLVPIKGRGVVYPTFHVQAPWGMLDVTKGGALTDSNMTHVTVGASQSAVQSGKGDGWTLVLSKGWTIVSGQRPGDYILQATP